ncbi:MAG: hypothetical protein WBI48_06270, partial [Thermacetogeniaceae bacterium]
SKPTDLILDNHIGIPGDLDKYSRRGRGLRSSSLGSSAVPIKRVKPHPYEITRMSTLWIQLAVYHESRARLRLVRVVGTLPEFTERE